MIRRMICSWLAAAMLALPLVAVADAAAVAATPAPAATTQAQSAESLLEALQKITGLAGDQNPPAPAAAQVAVFALERPLLEKPPEYDFFGYENQLALHSLLHRLHLAADDKGIEAVLVTFAGDTLNLAQAMEVRDALRRINRSGKRTFAYADSYDTATYIAASGASDICLLEGGELMLPGVSLEATFAKGLLDKVGVQADSIQIGEFKGADEEMTRSSASPQLRGELNRLLDGMYSQLIDSIAAARKLPAQDVRKYIDLGMIDAASAFKGHLVDHLGDKESLGKLLSAELGKEVELEDQYAAGDRDQVDLSSPFGILSLLMKKPHSSGLPQIALIHVQGLIVDGEGGDGLLGGASCGSEDVRRALRLAERDGNVKAIVLRIDSPGGSALASEAMWQAARKAAGIKPLIVSVGAMAASGGYYLACAGDQIIADPAAIVGSIGVVGGKLVVKDLYAKLGLQAESFSRGQNAAMFSSTQPFDQRQRQQLTDWMKLTYRQFTGRVMQGRGNKITDIDQVARGRIFLAPQAVELGLVDRLGGLDDALDAAARRVHMGWGGYEIRVIPASRTLADVISGQTEARWPYQLQTAAAGWRMLPANLAGPLWRQLQLAQMLQQRNVLLVCPVVR